MNPTQFEVSSYDNGILVIREHGKEVDTIKTDAQAVVTHFTKNYLLPTMTDKPYQAIIYEDCFGVFGLLLVKEHQFSGLHPLNAYSIQDAINAFKKLHFSQN